MDYNEIDVDANMDEAEVIVIEYAKYQKSCWGHLYLTLKYLSWKPEDVNINAIRIGISSIQSILIIFYLNLNLIGKSTGQQKAKKQPLLRINTHSQTHVFQFLSDNSKQQFAEALQSLLNIIPKENKSNDNEYEEQKKSILEKDKYLSFNMT